MATKPYSPHHSQAQVELISALGGPTALANLISDHLLLEGVDRLCPQAISMWKKRGIPYRYRAPLAVFARERGIGVPAGFLGEGVAPQQGEA